jgi:competence protein ComEC
MAGNALAAVFAAWLVQQVAAPSLLALPAVCWAGGALLGWCLGGVRLALPLLAAGWTLSVAGAQLAARLPVDLSGRDIVVRGVVCELPVRDPQLLRFVLEPQASSLWPWRAARLHLAWYDDAPLLRPGERWQLRLRLRLPRGLRNPGGFDFEQWSYVRGIAATGYVRASVLNRRLGPDGGGGCAIDALRERLAQRIAAALDGHPSTPWVLGVTIGAAQGLAPADWELMRRTGTTHLLAISGFNIAMVVAPLLLLSPMLARLLPWSCHWPWLRLVPVWLAAAAYTALAGFAVSTLRALAMLLLAGLMSARRQRLAGSELLAAAALVLLATDPATTVTAGFWLSFMGVAWLFLATRPDHGAGPPGCSGRAQQLWRATTDLGRAQCVLGLGLAPVSLAWFGQLSFVAPLVNFLAVPLFSLVIIPCALLGTVLLGLAPGAAKPLLAIAADVIGVLREGLQLAVAWAPDLWMPPMPAPLSLAAALLGAVLASWWRPAPLRALAPLLFLPLIAGLPARVPTLRVTVLDVGQGLAVLVQTARHTLIYDTGPAYRQRDAGESVVLPALRHAGVRAPDVLVVSHHDQDHAGGAPALLDAYPKLRVLAPDRGRLQAGRFEPCEEGQSWSWDGVHFSMLSPGADHRARSENDGSCVLRVATAAASLLLPGDIGRGREALLARQGLLAPADLVVAPHHGSRTSSGEDLVAGTRPRYVVFAAGHRNRWGFPAEAVRQRWAESGACLLETAARGALRFEAHADGPLQLVRSERIDAARIWTLDVDRQPPCHRRAVTGATTGPAGLN